MDLPYVCEFCGRDTKRVFRMDVSDDEGDEGKPHSLMMVCIECRDQIVEVAGLMADSADQEIDLDLRSGDLVTNDDELRRGWERLAARRRRW
jgi:hypothetical protein